MKKVLTFLIGFAFMLAMSSSTKADITMTFEEFLGSDGVALGTYYTGVKFEAGSSGQDWIAADVTAGGYNASSWPSGTTYGSGQYWMYDNVAAWTGIPGDNGKITFPNADASYVELGYGAFTEGGGIALYMDAYDSDGNLLDSDNGVSNLRYIDGNSSGPGTLRVDAINTNISYVIIHDTGNFWEVDNISTDATGIGKIPAPGALLLGSIGIGLVGYMRRRKTL